MNSNPAKVIITPDDARRIRPYKPEKAMWTYRIREDLCIVERIKEGDKDRTSYTEFYWLETAWQKFQRSLKANGSLELLTLYSIARDELIERGLIQDK